MCVCVCVCVVNVCALPGFCISSFTSTLSATIPSVTLECDGGAVGDRMNSMVARVAWVTECTNAWMRMGLDRRWHLESVIKLLLSTFDHTSCSFNSFKDYWLQRQIVEDHDAYQGGSMGDV